MCEFSRFAPHAHPIAVQCFTMESRPVGKKLNEGCFVKSGKWGFIKVENVFFVKKSGKWRGCFFCKKWTFMYSISIFLFYILLIWGCIHTQRTPSAY